MQKFNFYFILFLLSCADNLNDKGKKGDFSFKNALLVKFQMIK